MILVSCFRRLIPIFLMTAAILPAASPKVIAHRGGPAEWPENTIPAFQNAIRLGVDVLEFDMNVTSDGQIILHHDSTVNGAICKSAKGISPGPILSLSLEMLRTFDCGSTPPASHPQQKPVSGAAMPTLDEFLKAVQSSKVLLLGETKMPPEGEPSPSPERFVERIYQSLRKHNAEDRFILQSADYRTIDAMHKLNPRIALCLLSARRFKPEYLALARKHQTTHLMLRTDDVDKAGVQKLQAAGIQVYSGTANKEAEWRAYRDMGMDGILTDDPRALMRVLR